MDSIEDDMTEFREQLQQNSAKTNTLESNNNSLTEIKATLEHLKKENSELKRAKDDLENRGRRNNLLFYGINQDDYPESWESSEEKVKDVLKNNLNINEDVEFERVHRIVNAPLVRGAKPIIAMFTKFKDKSNVLSNAKLLKDTDISIGEDFSRRVRNIRKRLLEFRKSLTEENPKLTTHLRYDKLITIDPQGLKTVYTVDELTGNISHVNQPAR
ncbi:uncharacterized protein [Ptychodera flava]|uniref:uncharacterized protein n=1 Tax=Ptychodera flava TaxID=63121 RepID=UPI00396A192F